MQIVVGCVRLEVCGDVVTFKLMCDGKINIGL